ncbi:MAG: MFS transporter [Gemmatimonadales bacterium]
MRRETRLGLGANWRQFTLLVVVNAFVGAMVGLERTVVPLIAEQDFGVVSRAAILSFIGTFGLVKAIANLFAGRLSDQVGRRRVLIAGWLAGVPVPFMVMWAPAWSWIVAANVLLGVNQGLAWSTTVIMKIDLVGPRRRGLAMGLNEFAGYVAVGAAALASGLIASRFGLRPEPFYLGIAFAALGLGLSLFFVRDTVDHVRVEAGERDSNPTRNPSESNEAGRLPDSNAASRPTWREVFARTSWRDKSLSSCSQAGLVNNLNDGLAWGLFPLFFASGGMSLDRIATLAAAYPLAWGMLQLGTGALSDHWGRKPLIVSGMVLQGLALFAVATLASFGAWLGASIALGLGTALVYPTLLAAVGDVAEPDWRASAIGVYRLWRDGGYAVGALAVGFIADALGGKTAISATAGLTVASGLVVALRMPSEAWRVRAA